MSHPALAHSMHEYIVLLADSWLHALRPVNTTVNTTEQVRQLQEKWQAHAKAACLNCAHCRQLRQQLVHKEPAAVEAELFGMAAEQQ